MKSLPLHLLSILFMSLLLGCSKNDESDGPEASFEAKLEGLWDVTRRFDLAGCESFNEIRSSQVTMFRRFDIDKNGNYTYRREESDGSIYEAKGTFRYTGRVGSSYIYQQTRTSPTNFESPVYVFFDSDNQIRIIIDYCFVVNGDNIREGDELTRF